MLAKREHSAAELQAKLRARGFSHRAVNEVICQLCEEELLSDTRFAEAYVRSRVAKGYGPAAIHQALRVRGVSEDVIAACLDDHRAEWGFRLRSLKNKRFGPDAPSCDAEQARQVRFLCRRGFTMKQVCKALKGVRERTGSPQRPGEELAPALRKERLPRL